jgi:hypothetical protein
MSMLSIIAASRRRAAFDADAADYFARIVTAGSSISAPNKSAVDAFVKGCKADGIWTAIKASCLLAGPDDLTGALVPLVGAAPTNNGPFVSGDYNRTTGLIGNGTSKYLNSNRNNNADPQNNQHMAVYVTDANTTVGNAGFIGNGLGDAGCSQIIVSNAAFYVRTRSQSSTILDSATTGSALLGTLGISRAASGSYTVIQQSVTVTTLSTASQTPFSQNTVVYGRNLAASNNARMSFYSIGEALDLAALDARLATYMSALT